MIKGILKIYMKINHMYSILIRYYIIKNFSKKIKQTNILNMLTLKLYKNSNKLLNNIFRI